MLFAVGIFFPDFRKTETDMMFVEFGTIFMTLLRIFLLLFLHSVQTARGAMRMKSMSVASYNAAIKSISHVPDHWEAAFLIRQDMEESVCLLRSKLSGFSCCGKHCLHPKRASLFFSLLYFDTIF